ncbi:hypothetical protein Mp_7g15450 [Marchantia polymorpha subsp. ruderalis]|uniref:LsmAD domain-containing protein n=2 Tax=Marchantia polymorpha TaxID=3197 RepID=A0AAF6BZW7_MARPO|nr:hypothetical protein MARPO_0009s0229 [Marchantia polymorpha]PTQ47171.1 hypothetical protein MARPO_0009s0229 [Marchantia polymorpha]BBN17550.1 hypothetical protein Mp_7g15450 [Marchantia polymorpha subsp. ruderalis]BBN17551.1 hypothetical protein Mp_7g15450 [Marchantia polymorpha subsp. ruderalis]|eukprot:PTQ47159.1 hypothetical protein MARPO_0009s0229 [Marchantia polymorpha]
MSQPQVQQRPAAANGVGRRRPERDVSNNRADAGFRSDSQNWRSSSQGPSRSGPNPSASPGAHGHGHFNSISSNSGSVGGSTRSSGERAETGVASLPRGAGVEKPHHDRLLFMAMCLIGQPVEVQVKNGSFYSGIFHTANTDKDFGIVLKMARLIKDGTVKGGKSDAVKEAARKAPQKTLVIPAKDFVQIIAKDVSLTGDAIANGRARENRAEIVTDAVLSQGRQREVERELKPWKPDDEAPRNLGLESTFQSSWNRNWDQFETNKALFGVETTFNEELYTTKLERGPQMREREREAWRIAREIEGQTTRNPHVAEERGIRIAPELETMDEESKFSSVIRGAKLDVGEDGEYGHIDDQNGQTFGSAFGGSGGASTSPSGSSVSTPITRESESKTSRPSSADSQTNNGPSQKDPLLPLRERRATSIEKGEVAVLDSQADTHREHVRLRQLLVGDKSKRSSKAGGSPYHSPVGRGSPLSSPLVGDPASIQALNLDPSCPQVPDDVYKEFLLFKTQETLRKKETSKKQREDQVNELKNFSESLRIKDSELSSPKAAPKASSGDPVSNSSRHGSQDGGARPLGSLDSKSSLPSSGSPVHLTAAQASAPPASALPIPVGLGGQLSGTPSTLPSIVTKQGTATAGTSFDASPMTTPAVGQSSGALSSNGLSAPSSLSTSFGAPSPLSVPSVPVSHGVSPSVSPSSSVSSVASGAPPCTKKSSLNPNAKEFKLNPNAKAFTPSFTARPASPMIQGPVYMHAGLPPVTPMQGVPVGMNVGQYMQQPGQPSQYTQYNNAMAAAAVGSSPQYMQPPGGYVPGATGPPVLPGQPNMKMPPHSQQQVVGPPYGQQQQLRYPPQGHPMQPQPYLHANAQLYPQQMLYPSGQLLYIPQYPQGQPVPPPPQGPLPPQPSQQTQQQKHRGGGIPQMHYSGAPPYLPGQHHLPQPQISHLHNSLQPAPGGLAPTSMPGVQQSPQGMVAPTGSGGSVGGGNGIRVGGKGGAGSFAQQ